MLSTGGVCLDNRELVAKSISGARWTLLLSAVAIPLGYGTNIILGRITPEALGLYSLVIIASGVISTFFLLGGANVIINFIPTLTKETKLPFLFSYLSVTFFFAILGFAFTILCPSFLEFFFKREITSTVYIYLALLLPTVLLQTFVLATLRAEMDIKAAAISVNAFRIASFFIFAFSYLALPSALKEHTIAFVALTVLMCYFISLFVGAWRLYRNQIRNWLLSFRWFFPQDLWRFSLTFYLGALSFFVVQNVDQIVVLRYLSLKDLGYYRAALVTAGFVQFVPNHLMEAMYPTFCNLIARGEQELLEHVYTKSVAVGWAASGMTGMFVFMFASQVLALFGLDFHQAKSALLILIVGFMLAFPLGAVNGGLLVAQRKTTHTMVLNAIAAVYGTALYVVLTQRYGLLGTALACVVSSLLRIGISTMLIYRLFDMKVNRKSLAIPLISFITILAILFLSSYSFTWGIVGWLSGTAIFTAVSLKSGVLTIPDLSSPYRRFRKAGAAVGTAFTGHSAKE